MSKIPEIMTQAAFARHIGRAKSYITKLKKEERIVMTENGKRVKVAESMALIEKTGGLRQDVAQRHAQERGEIDAEPSVPRGTPDNDDTAAGSLADVRRQHEFEKYRITKLERMKIEGDLIPKEVVDFWVDDFGVSLRTEIELMPDRLAPVVAPMQDLAEVRAALQQFGEKLLKEIHEKMEKRRRERLNAD